MLVWTQKYIMAKSWIILSPIALSLDFQPLLESWENVKCIFEIFKWFFCLPESIKQKISPYSWSVWNFSCVEVTPLVFWLDQCHNQGVWHFPSSQQHEIRHTWSPKAKHLLSDLTNFLREFYPTGYHRYNFKTPDIWPFPKINFGYSGSTYKYLI